MIEKTNLQTGETITTESAFRSNTEILLEATNLDELYETWTSKILESIDTFQNNGSCCVFKSIVSLDIHTVKYRPMDGSSYIPLSWQESDCQHEKRGQIVFQVGNHYIHLVDRVDAHPERIDKKLRANADLLNWGGITFPTPLNDIDKFEKNNLNVSVNVAGFADL